jgi:hypothetical protein
MRLARALAHSYSPGVISGPNLGGEAYPSHARIVRALWRLYDACGEQHAAMRRSRGPRGEALREDLRRAVEVVDASRADDGSPHVDACPNSPGVVRDLWHLCGVARRLAWTKDRNEAVESFRRMVDLLNRIDACVREEAS